MVEQSDKVASLAAMVADRALRPKDHPRRICLLLGAGADISSGGMTFAELKHRAIERFSGRQLFDLTPEASIDREFEQLFTRLAPDQRSLLIESVFRQLGQLEPSESYKLLILLIEAGGIDAVLTTNFDLMLESAQTLLGRDLLQVYSPGFVRPYPPQGQERYELPKRPYVKLHGDLASRAVVSLVRSELADARYDADTSALVRSILASHDLIMAGYGGFDTTLATMIAEAVEPSRTRIYWCGPSLPNPDAPLSRLLGKRAEHIVLTFDALITVIGRPVLERPSLIPTEPTFVSSLFKWRVDYCNRDYAKLYATRKHRDISDTFARRNALEAALSRFLKPNKPLALVTGPSGFGKSTLGLRLLKSWETRHSTRLLLLRARDFPENGDLEQYVGEQLGGLGFKSPFSFFLFERWLQRNELQLVVFIDGVNEFSDEIGRNVGFLRNILRFCYFLPEGGSSLRLVATIRQETWNAMLPHLDLGRLQHAVWSPGAAEEGFSTLACDVFTDEELREAVQRMGTSLTLEALDTMAYRAYEQLRDPYLLRVVAESASESTYAVPSASHVKTMIDGKLRATASVVAPSIFLEALAEVAMCGLERGRSLFRGMDLRPAERRTDILRLARDLDLVRDGPQGLLQFDHDRTFEYFIAVALANGLGPPLESLDDLRAFLKRYHADGRAIAAARLHFELHARQSLPLVTKALGLAERGGVESIEMRRLFEFVREVLVRLAEIGDTSVETYLADAIEAGRDGRIRDLHLKAVVQAAAALPSDIALELLGRVQHPASALPQTEAQIYAIDRLVGRFLNSSTLPIDLLEDTTYGKYFGAPSLDVWQRVGRVASFAMQLGPDNTHADEYDALSRSVRAAFTNLAGNAYPQDPAAFATFFTANCDRLLFNATPEGMRRFFGNGRRSDFVEILATLAEGATMSIVDFHKVEPFTQSLEFDIEYHLVAALFVVSSLNDLPGTLTLVETLFARLDQNANPVQVDFLEEVLVYLHVIHALDFDIPRFGAWEERILASWPDVLLHRPGLVRGERRGFVDQFDRIFEDGFGVIYPYGTLVPSKRRRALRFADYIEAASDTTDIPLPMYARWLGTYLAEDRIEEALQLLQGIAGVIISWPLEGLSAMRGAIGHEDARIRRAVMRILAEAYNRHPKETLRFLRVAGVAVSDDELLEIKVRNDARLGRRQVSEEEYARLGHLLLQIEGAKSVFIGSLFDVLSATSLEAAIVSIFQRIGWRPAASTHQARR